MTTPLKNFCPAAVVRSRCCARLYDMDDSELVQRAAAGDAAAFELLVRRHAGALFRLARPIVRDDHLAEEVVQDTFFKAHRNLATFRGDAKVSTWLSSICYRTAIDRVRASRRNVVSLEAAREQPGHQDDIDLRLALSDALDELPSDEREAFYLVQVLGYSREEAAQIVDVPASTLRSRVARARQRLAESLRALEESVAQGPTP